MAPWHDELKTLHSAATSRNSFVSQYSRPNPDRSAATNLEEYWCEGFRNYFTFPEQLASTDPDLHRMVGDMVACLDEMP